MEYNVSYNKRGNISITTTTFFQSDYRAAKTNQGLSPAQGITVRNVLNGNEWRHRDAFAFRDIVIERRRLATAALDKGGLATHESSEDQHTTPRFINKSDNGRMATT